jgi:hypothetical protein
MFNFFKTRKLEFQTNIPGLENLMPIIKASEYIPPWKLKAISDLKQKRKDPEYGLRGEAELHVAKCPGIHKLMKHGWIVRAWQDVVIETNGDGNSFRWTSVIDQQPLNGADYIQYHGPEVLRVFMDNWPENTLSTIVRFNTGWTCIVPKGYYLLEMPIPYNEENRFTTLPGYFPYQNGVAGMNPQLMWHVMNGKTLIKAGTPLAQYILVPEKQMDFEMTVFGDKKLHIQDMYGLAHNSMYVKNYNKTKKAFEHYQ